jgi:hypothetical protein
VVRAVDDLGDADFVAVVKYPSTHDKQPRSRYPKLDGTSLSLICVLFDNTHSSREKEELLEEQTTLHTCSAVSTPMEYFYVEQRMMIKVTIGWFRILKTFSPETKEETCPCEREIIVYKKAQ